MPFTSQHQRQRPPALGPTNVDDFMMGANADVRPTAGPTHRHGQFPLHADVIRFPG